MQIKTSNNLSPKIYCECHENIMNVTILYLYNCKLTKFSSKLVLTYLNFYYILNKPYNLFKNLCD